MRLLIAIALLAVFAILYWRGLFPGFGFGTDCFRLHPAFPGCSLPLRPSPAFAAFF